MLNLNAESIFFFQAYIFVNIWRHYSVSLSYWIVPFKIQFWIIKKSTRQEKNFFFGRLNNRNEAQNSEFSELPKFEYSNYCLYFHI